MLKKVTLLNFFSLFILYFVQGLPYGLQSRYLPIVMRLNGISLSELGLFKLLLIPWILKFFIAAFIIDVYRTKRFWLFTSLLLLCLNSYACSILNLNFHYIALIMFVLNMASVIQDICVDWFAISALDKEDLGIGNTIQVTGFKLGTLFSGGVIVWFINYIPLPMAFFILGSIYLLSFLLLKVSLFHVEKMKNNKDEYNDMKPMADGIIKQNLPLKERINLIFYEVPGTFWMCIFLLIYKLGEQSSLNMLPLYLVDNNIESSRIGLWTGVLGQISSISGSFIAGLWLKKTHKNISTYKWLDYTVKARLLPILIITITICCTNITYVHFETRFTNTVVLYTLFISVLFQLFLSGFLTTITFTVMMQISFTASEQIRATHYSLLATFEVLGKLLFQPFISVYTDYFGYSNAFILFTALYVLCIINMRLYPKCLRF